MDLDAEKLEQTVLALLYLNSFDDRAGGKRAWKGFPWGVMDQLHEINGLQKDNVHSLTRRKSYPTGICG